MNKQKYKESLNKISEPIALSDVKQKMDLRGLMKYAKEKGIKVEEMSDEEKAAFIRNTDTNQKQQEKQSLLKSNLLFLII